MRWATLSRCARWANGRLTQETHEGTNACVYDDANRLIEVDGVPFTRDDNTHPPRFWAQAGNLLSDGVSTYTYDRANRAGGITRRE